MENTPVGRCLKCVVEASREGLWSGLGLAGGLGWGGEEGGRGGGHHAPQLCLFITFCLFYVLF